MKKRRIKLPEWMTVHLDVPPDTFPGNCRIELRGKHSMTLHGCTQILKYTETAMEFAVEGDTLSVDGLRLSCASYLDGRVVVEGEIVQLHFGETKA